MHSAASLAGGSSGTHLEGTGTMKYKYYLFDLDGTLTDPGIGITNSVMYALEKFGIHVSDRETL